MEQQQQLSGIDASFLYLETPETPMHVAGLTYFQLPEGFEGSFYRHFRRFFESRLHTIPIFSKRLAPSLYDLDHPGWVDDPDLDLDYHLRETALPAPGTEAQLEELIARLHSNTLDRSRPLWQFYIITGLANGQGVLYSKVHHAAVDGGAGMAINKALYDVTAIPREVAPPPPKPEAAAKLADGRRSRQGHRRHHGQHDAPAIEDVGGGAANHERHDQRLPRQAGRNAQGARHAAESDHSVTDIGRAQDAVQRHHHPR